MNALRVPVPLYCLLSFKLRILLSFASQKSTGADTISNLNVMPLEPPNTVPCGGLENEYDGCGSIFPRMGSDSNICNKCKRLNEAGFDQTKIEALKVS
jgi:hypothetical protein